MAIASALPGALPVDVQSTIGALLVGLLVSCFLFGILTLQAYLYSTNFPEDRLPLKLLVCGVWCLEFAHCICVCHTVYRLAIVGYGDPSFLVKTPASLSMAVLFSGIISPAVQMFFAHRVRVISGGQLFIPILCWALSILRLAMAMSATAEAFKMTSLATYEAEWKWLLTAVLSVGVATDGIIAGALCYYLSQHKARSMRSTAKILDRIIVWTVQTGLATGVVSLVMIIFFVTMPNNFIWLGIFTCLARFYSNSLLASLNARTAIRGSATIINATPASDGRQLSHGSGKQPQQVLITMSSMKTRDIAFGHEESVTELGEGTINKEVQ